MPPTGYIQVNAYASNAQIPLKGVAISIRDKNDKPIAMRLTNRDGQLDQPIEITVPAASASQSPGTGVIPFSTINLTARIADFEAIEEEDVQVFPGIVTIQNLEMIPLSELPESWNQLELFITPPQNL